MYEHYYVVVHNLKRERQKVLDAAEIKANIKNEIPDVTNSTACMMSPLECFISFNFNTLILVLILVLFFLLFVHQIFIKNLLQFGIISNYCLIQIFFFFFACYNLIIIVLNDHNANLFEKIKNNVFGCSGMLNLIFKKFQKIKKGRWTT